MSVVQKFPKFSAARYVSPMLGFKAHIFVHAFRGYQVVSKFVLIRMAVKTIDFSFTSLGLQNALEAAFSLEEALLAILGQLEQQESEGTVGVQFNKDHSHIWKLLYETAASPLCFNKTLQLEGGC